MTKFEEEILKDMQRLGIPTIEMLSHKLVVSERYLLDVLHGSQQLSKNQRKQMRRVLQWDDTREHQVLQHAPVIIQKKQVSKESTALSTIRRVNSAFDKALVK